MTGIMDQSAIATLALRGSLGPAGSDPGAWLVVRNFNFLCPLQGQNTKRFSKKAFTVEQFWIGPFIPL